MIVNCKAEVMRLVYEGKVAKGKEVVGVYPGYLKAIDEKNEILQGGKFGKVYKLSINKLVDIRESDNVRIDEVEYSVKGVACRKGGSLELTSVILEKWK